MSQTQRNVPHALVDCGCETTVYQDGSGVEIHYCPTHEAAPELLEALKGMEKASQEIAIEFIEHKRATNWKIVNDAYVAAAHAIAKAEGRA